jgi:hypothetical protein
MKNKYLKMQLIKEKKEIKIKARISKILIIVNSSMTAETRVINL